MNGKLIAVIIAVICSFIGAIGQIFFKLGSEHLTFNIIEQLTNYKLIIGLIFYGIATVGYVFALKQADLSFVYPVVALSYVWVPMFSVVFLHEPFPIQKWIGVAGILISVIFISL